MYMLTHTGNSMKNVRPMGTYAHGAFVDKYMTRSSCRSFSSYVTGKGFIMIYLFTACTNPGTIMMHI
jgi:hypothetical protein